MTAVDAIAAIPLYQQRTLTPPSTVTLPPAPGRPNQPAFSSLSSYSTSDRTSKTLPRATLRNSPDNSTNFQQLLFLRECFHKSEFWDEVAILDRMHYKNRNQHRQAGYFQRLCECRRIVARIKELNIAGLVDEFVQKFYSGRSLKALSVKSQWDSIPYRSAVAFTMTRIIGGILLLRKLQSALHETYGAFYQLMSKTQFMAFALIAIGLCSRLSLLSKAWAKEHVDCYRLLETWMKFFPKDEARVEDVNYESQLPESIDSVLASSLPDILDDQLPPAPAYQPDDQSPEQTSSAKAVGSDLGEVIQRTQLLPSALATESILSSRPSPKPSPVRKHKLSSRSPSLEPENRQDQQPVDPATVSSDSHSNLLGELDMIFGSKPSTSNSSPSSTQKKKDMALPDLDDIFKRKKQKSKDKKPSVAGSGISNSSSPMSSAPSTPGSGFSTKSKSSTGSKSNFDSIFDFGLGSSSGSKTTPGLIPSSPSPGKKADGSNKVRKDKKDIDDIFGSIKKPKKKAPTSEIDSIFGPPKKKKKAP